MNKTLKKQWIKALESGKFKKGKNKLVFRKEYCCLGVLGSICGLNNRTMQRKFGNDVLPNNFRGLDEFTQSELASLNDNSDTFEPVIKKIKELV